MSYEKWSAVCPRCSTQNTSENDPCSNCGNGPVLFQEYRRRPYEWDIPRTFQCRRCGTTFNDMRCRNCDTLIGGVTGSNAFPVGMLIFLGVVAVVIFGGLGSWLTSSDGNHDNKLPPRPSPGQYIYPSVREPFSPGSLPSEDGIRSVVNAFTDDWNQSNVTGIRSLWCSGTAPDANILSKQIDSYGRIGTSVRNIGGAGDEASAEVTVTTSHGGEMEPWWFVNEGGSWKPCKSTFIWTQANGH